VAGGEGESLQAVALRAHAADSQAYQRDIPLLPLDMHNLGGKIRKHTPYIYTLSFSGSHGKPVQSL
jgi:hypothetical protein